MEYFYRRKPIVNIITKLTRGFTLVELMITIAVAGIIVAIAIPSLGSFVTKMRVDNEVMEVQRLLLIARNTAINSGANVIVCPLNQNGSGACTNNWDEEISVFIDNNNDNTYNVVNNERLLITKSAINTGDKLEFAFNSITYNASGQLNNNNFGLISYCPRGYTDFSRGIEVTLSGRSSLSADNNGDGKDQDRAGTNINC